MMKLNHGRPRRRWIWTLLFLLLATVSMVGPTQAVSGVVAASAAVMEAISAALGPEAPSSAPVAGPNLRRSIDELMTPDFTGLVGTAPASPPADPGDVVPVGPPLAAASTASSQTGSQSSSGYNGATGSPGYQGGSGSGPRLGGAGSGGMSMGSFGSGAFSQEIAETGSSSESSGQLVTDTFSLNLPELEQGHVPSVEDDTRAFGPSAPGNGPGNGPASGGSPSSGGPADIDVPIPDDKATPEPSVPTFSANPPSNGTTPTDPNPVPPDVLEPLLEELDVPPALASQAPLRISPAALADEPGVFQIPEPSMLALFALGTAVAARRRLRRRDR